MTGTEALDLTQAALWVALSASAPIVIAVMIVGIAISMLQALTQIQEMTLTFVPKIIVAVIVLAVSSPFIARTINAFAEQSYARILGPETAAEEGGSEKQARR